MRPQRKAFQLLILLEVIGLIGVLAYGILQAGTSGRGETTGTGPKSTADSYRQSLPEGEEHKFDQAGNGATGSRAEDNTSEQEIGGGLSVGFQEPDADGEDAGTQDETAGGGSYEGLSPSPEFPPEVNEKLSNMTLEEKVAQMFLITPEALTHNDAVNIARSGTRDAIRAYPVGGLVYDAKNFQGKEQTKALLEGVQGYSMERIGLPLFLAVEEIGGNGHSPLAVENKYGLQASPAVLGAGGAPEKAAEAAAAIAEYLKAESFNLNLMPVAGLAPDMEESQQSRCYGADSATVAMMLAESVTACRNGGIGTAVGYFPWKGAQPGCTKGLTEWQDSDGLAFGAAVNAGTDLVMLSNASFEAMTREGDKPCSLSGGAVSYLRGQMGYTGIIMTDPLSEKAVTGRYGSGEAAVEAVKAGADLLFCPENFEEACQAVVDAVNQGQIPEEQINASAGRILTKKLSMQEEDAAEE